MALKNKFSVEITTGVVSRKINGVDIAAPYVGVFTARDVLDCDVVFTSAGSDVTSTIVASGSTLRVGLRNPQTADILAQGSATSLTGGVAVVPFSLNTSGMVDALAGTGGTYVPAFLEFEVTAATTFRQVFAQIPARINREVITNEDLTAEEYVPASSALVVATGSTASRALETRFGEMLTVKDFGAAGDAVTNDNAAFAAAIAYAQSSGKARIYVPAGDYKLTAALVLPNFVSLIGDGIDVTILRFSGAVAGIRIVGTSGTQIVKNCVSDMAIYGSGGATYGLELEYAPYSYFSNLRIYGWVIGVAITNTWNTNFYNVLAESCSQDGFNLGVDANSIGLTRCSAFSNTRAGFYIDGSRSCVLTDPGAEGNQYGIYIYCGSGISTHKVSIVGGYIEGNTSQEIFIASFNSSNVPRMVSIRDVYFVALTAIQAIRVAAVAGLIIDGCHFSVGSATYTYSTYLVDSGTSSGVVRGSNMDQSTGGVYKGSGMAWSLMDVTAQ